MTAWSGAGEEVRALGKKLYIGNLPFSIVEADLRDAFEPHGEIESIAVITDRDTGRPRGFAFIEYVDSASAEKAQSALDGTDMGGRQIRVNEAQDRGRDGGGGGGGGRGGGGGGRRY